MKQFGKFYAIDSKHFVKNISLIHGNKHSLDLKKIIKIFTNTKKEEYHLVDKQSGILKIM